MDPADPNHAQKQQALLFVSRDALRRWIDWKRRGIDPLARAETPPPEEKGGDGNGNTQDAVADDRAYQAENHDDGFQMDFTQPAHSGFQPTNQSDDALIAQQLSGASAESHAQANAQDQDESQFQTETAEPPPKRKRGRPRKNRAPVVPPAVAPVVEQPVVVQQQQQQYHQQQFQPEPLRPQPPPSQPTPPQPRVTKRGRPSAHSKSNYIPGRIVWGPNNEPRFVLYGPDDEQQTPEPTGSTPTPSVSVTPNPETSTPSQSQPQPPYQQQQLFTVVPAASPPPPPPLPPAVPSYQAPPRRPNMTISTPTPTPAAPAPSTTQKTIAVYFRIHPSTSIIYGLPTWITTVAVSSLDEVRTKAVARYPNAVCARVEGIVKDGDSGEIPLPIPGDEELMAYLEHVREIQGAPIFSVQLVPR